MDQPKVFEFAKEIGMETIALMDKIKEWKLPVKSHMATLSAELMGEIRTRLDAERESSGPKKKSIKKVAAATTKKAAEKEEKPAAKKTATKAAAKSTTAGKSATAKIVTKATTKRKVEPEAPVEPEEVVPVEVVKPVQKVVKVSQTKVAAQKVAVESAAAKKGPGVIRRKAGELEARAQALAEQEALQQAVAAQNKEALDESGETQSESGATGLAQGESAASATHMASAGAGAAAVEPKKVRGNIIGRMDLRRVVTPQSGGQGGGFGGGVGTGPRPTRTAPRNIRTGFVAPLPMDEPRAISEEAERKDREEKERKKRANLNKEEQQIFTATEFRKREVIFQPKKKKPLVGRDAKKTMITVPKASKRVVKVDNVIKLSELAAAINVKAPLLIKKLMANGIMATMTTDLDFDTVALTVPEFGWEAQNVHRTVDELQKDLAFGELEAERVLRPPVVTVMGHVDHGKTTLLDAIRKTDVAAGEAGGITQHIGAYTVTLPDGAHVTFIDTPGHEAFTAMRARGANVTDIAIIVVAADDGLMPQTAEAINHAKAAGVPIIVAVNKMDRPGANPDRIKQQLTEFELVPEEWGGTTIFCPVSALKREGVQELLEQIRLVAEVQELKSNPKRSATGVVIESRMERGRGAVATLLVKDGTLHVGDDFVAGTVIGRIRSMMNDQGQQVKEAGPGFAVEIMGLPEPPAAGDGFDVVQDENLALKLADQRKNQVRAANQPSAKMSLDELFAKVKSADQKEVSIVLKTDVAGSLEAIRAMIEKAGTTEVKTKLVHAAIGGITESDVLLASTAKGIVIGFNVRPDGEAQRVAREKGIEIKSYSIIYELIDDLKKIMTGMLDPKFAEKQMGRAEVRNTFVVPKVGTIAGCFVVDGKIARGHQLRLVRDGRIVYEGKLGSLKRFKDDAKEVASGFECGIGIENFNDIKMGDVIESYVMEQQVAQLT